MPDVTIARMEAIPVELPVRRPLEMAVATVTTRTCILVRITTEDGAVGWGESVLARYFTGESLASAVDLIDGVYAGVFTGEDATRVADHRDLMRRISVYNQGARAAVEMAMHDVVARTSGIPLHQHHGELVRRRVPTIWHVSGGSAEEMADEAAEAVVTGYPLVKVKVGKDIDFDVNATMAVRESIGPDVLLLPDANQGWEFADALRYCTAVAEVKPGFVEQPLPRWDMPGMQRLVEASPVLIAGDEGIFDVHDLRAYLEYGAANAVVAKLMKAAGPIGVRELAAVAAGSGIGVHFAGMAGQTSISAAHGAHLAATLPELRYGSGISPQYLADDIAAEPYHPIEGHFVVGDEPGTGVEIDEEKLAHYRTDT